MKRFPITIEQGKLNIPDLAGFKQYIKSIEGKRELMIGTAYEVRTAQQNKYLHLAIGLIAKETGDSIEVEKIRMKHELGMYEIVEIEGKQLFNWKSTAKLSKQDFSVFTNHILQRADFLGIKVLTPEEYFQMLAEADKEIKWSEVLN